MLDVLHIGFLISFVEKEKNWTMLSLTQQLYNHSYKFQGLEAAGQFALGTEFKSQTQC